MARHDPDTDIGGIDDLVVEDAVVASSVVPDHDSAARIGVAVAPRIGASDVVVPHGDVGAPVDADVVLDLGLPVDVYDLVPGDVDGRGVDAVELEKLTKRRAPLDVSRLVLVTITLAAATGATM